MVPSASPLSEDLDNIKRMEDAGAAAVVCYSLFEEQIHSNDMSCTISHRARKGIPSHDLFPRAFRIQSRAGSLRRSHRKSEGSLQHSDHCKAQRLFARWLDRLAALIEQAGADALQLNNYSIPTDMERTPPGSN